MNYLIGEETLTDIANAIRKRTGTSDLINSDNMADMINTIEAGNGVEPFIITVIDMDEEGM